MPANLKPLPPRIGKGPAFPFRFNSNTGQVEIAEGEQEIKNSLYRLLTTDPSEEPFLSQGGVPFGVRLQRSMFTDLVNAKNILQFEVGLAIATWEPRVVLQGVEVTSAQVTGGITKIIVVIRYVYRSTGRQDNIVLPQDN